jgi:hypothetical protein
MNQSKEEKLSLLSELIKLARIDKEVKEMEHHFLLQIANQLQIAQNEFETLFEQYIDFKPPKDDFNRILQLQRLILMSSVDLENHPDELNAIKNIGINMGLNPLAVDEVIVKMHQYENKIIPPDVLIGIFTKTFN